MRHCLCCLLALIVPGALRADILRWDDGQVIPGTEGVNLGPGVDLAGWNSASHNLQYGNFGKFPATEVDLTGANFSGSWLENSSFERATLTNTNFAGAVVAGVDFGYGATTRGLTADHLYSTASHQAKDLQRISLSSNDLGGWNFSGQNLTNANLSGSTLVGANLSGAVVTGVSLNSALGLTADQLYSTASYEAKNLQGIGLDRNDLSGWNLSGQNLTNASLYQSTLTNTNLSGAVVAGAGFDGATDRGFTADQLYSTASYQAKDLQRIFLRGNNLGNWNFGGQNLTNAYLDGSVLTSSNLSGANLTNADLHESMLTLASLSEANLTNAYLERTTFTNANLSGANLANANLGDSTLANANLSGAVVAGTSFRQTTERGFTADQLYSTASYQAKNLQGIGLVANDLSGWNLSGQNLTNANLWQAALAGANLSGAVVTGAEFGRTTDRGFTPDQVYSTASYQAKNLQGIGLGGNDLSGWDFSSQNLTKADLAGSILTNANLLGTVVREANLRSAQGFTADQLYSTASYEAKNLQGIELGGNDLSDWNLSGQNLANADLKDAHLTGANLSGANLANANLQALALTGANLSHAVVAGAEFGRTTGSGFTAVQLYSTGSYHTKDLQRIGLGDNDLSGWNLSGQNLANADLRGSTLTGANLDFADLRGTRRITAFDLASLHNSILPDGTVDKLTLVADELLVVRDDDGLPDPPPTFQRWLNPRPPIPITVGGQFTISDGGVLELRFDADPWDSLISFEPGIPVQFSGTLELTFAQEADPASRVGHTLDIFNWTGVSPTGAFTVASLYDWDLSRLYTTGEVTLLAAGGVIAGDATGDSKVDMADFGLLKDHFGTVGSRADGDSNGDRKVDLADFGLLKANFGKSGVAPVPEPSTFLLAALAGLGLAFRRRGLRASPHRPQ